MAQHNKLGEDGERAAREFLISKEATPCAETNWRMGHLEIDIAQLGAAACCLHIIEVKTRASDHTSIRWSLSPGPKYAISSTPLTPASSTAT